MGVIPQHYHRLKPPVGTLPNLGHPHAIGLRHFWPINEGMGEILHDVVGKLNATSATAAQWLPNIPVDLDAAPATRIFGPCVDVTAAASHFTCPSKVIVTDRPWAISFWVNLDAFTGTSPGVLSFQSDQTDPFECFFSSDALYDSISFGSNASFARNLDDEANSTVLDKVVHVVYTYNGQGLTTAGNYTLYKNGRRVTLAASSTFTAHTNNTNIGSIGNAANPFDGAIVDLRFYHRDIPYELAKDMFDNPFGIFSATPVIIGPALPAAPIEESVADTVVPTESLSPAGSVYNRSVADTVVPTESLSPAGSVYNRSVADTVVPTEGLVEQVSKVVSDTVVPTEQVDTLLTHSESASDTAAPTESLSPAGSVYNRSVTDTAAPTESASGRAHRPEVCTEDVIRQTLTSYDFPIIMQNWKEDCVLAKPQLTTPAEGENFCPPVSVDPEVEGSGLFLKWVAVPDADFYVVQWAKTSEFNGPTLRGKKVVAATEYEMEVPDDAALGDEIHWRVMAFSDNGCVSEKSKPRAFKYNCKKGGGDGGRDSSQLCKSFNVEMKIKGPNDVKCKDNPSYNIEGTYNKTSPSGEVQIQLLNYKWELKAPTSLIQAGGGEKTVLLFVDEAQGGTVEITLSVEVRFQIIDGGVGTFVCKDKKTIRVDCGIEDGGLAVIPFAGVTNSFWAETTGTPTGSTYNINPLDDCLVDDSGNTATLAIEVNDQTDIPVGSIVRVFMDTTGSCFYFEHCVCWSSSGDGTGTGGF